MMFFSALSLFTSVTTTMAMHDEQSRMVPLVEELQSSLLLDTTPECWNLAIAQFHEHTSQNLERFCINLSSIQQKQFALQVTKCHLEDLDRPLYASRSAYCEQSLDTNCLKYLTDAGVMAYTQYITHVQVLCTRKTQELLISYQENLKNDAMQHLQQISELSRNQFIEYQDSLRAELPNQLKEMFVETFDDQVKAQIGELLHHQTAKQADFFADVQAELEIRDLEHRQQYEHWMHYQVSVMSKQNSELEKQRDSLRSQLDQLQALSDTVTQTSQNMQPLVGLQNLVTMATSGYTWVTFLLHFLGTFNIVWIMTRPKYCGTFRSYLFAVVITEAMVEMILSGAVHHGFCSDNERILYVTELRKWAMLIECATYIFGLLVGLSGAVNRESDGNDDHARRYEKYWEEHHQSYHPHHRAMVPVQESRQLDHSRSQEMPLSVVPRQREFATPATATRPPNSSYYHHRHHANTVPPTRGVRPNDDFVEEDVRAHEQIQDDDAGRASVTPEVEFRRVQSPILYPQDLCDRRKTQIPETQRTSTKRPAPTMEEHRNPKRPAIDGT